MLENHEPMSAEVHARLQPVIDVLADLNALRDFMVTGSADGKLTVLAPSSLRATLTIRDTPDADKAKSIALDLLDGVSGVLQNALHDCELAISALENDE